MTRRCRLVPSAFLRPRVLIRSLDPERHKRELLLKIAPRFPEMAKLLI